MRDCNTFVIDRDVVLFFCMAFSGSVIHGQRCCMHERRRVRRDHCFDAWISQEQLVTINVLVLLL